VRVTQVRFLVRFSNKGHAPADVRALSSRAFEAVKAFNGDVGNVRVSSYAIELDLLLDSKPELQDAVHALEAKLGPLLTLRELDKVGSQLEVGKEIRQGIELFNSERYWESHEAWEYAWRKASGAEKDVLQGIILVAAALVHLQKNEGQVALSIIERAYNKLAGKAPEYMGIDIEVLRSELSQMISAGNPQFVKIKTRG
jgi:hypothetical protein